MDEAHFLDGGASSSSRTRDDETGAAKEPTNEVLGAQDDEMLRRAVLRPFASRSSSKPVASSKTGPKGVLADWDAHNNGTANDQDDENDGRTSSASSRRTDDALLSSNKDKRQSAAKSKSSKLGSARQEQHEGDEDLPEEDEDPDGESQARAAYRARRLAEMRAAAAGDDGNDIEGGGGGGGPRTFGHLRSVGVDQFLSAIEGEPPSVPVLVHLFDDALRSCAKLDHALATLARAYPRAKFLRAKAQEVDFAQGADADALPTLLVYKAGQLERAIVRIDLEWQSGTRDDIHELLVGCVLTALLHLRLKR